MEIHKKFKQPTMAIPPLKKPDFSWARSNMKKTNHFAKHLANVFTPHPRNDNEIEAYLQSMPAVTTTQSFLHPHRYTKL